MSGHSKWSTIKRAKGATDAKRGNLFTKLSNSIAIAVREGGGGDVNFNFRLRLAVDKAREANMPKENISRAIEKGLGKSGAGGLENATYEGFGPVGVAVIVEVITDNTTRTGAELRAFFEKNGGRLGNPGSVSYLFKRVGEILVDKTITGDAILEKVLNAGGEDMVEDEGGFLVYTRPEDLHKVRLALESDGLKISEAELVWKSNVETEVAVEDGEKQEAVNNFIERLEEMDDVQGVYVNAI